MTLSIYLVTRQNKALYLGFLYEILFLNSFYTDMDASENCHMILIDINGTLKAEDGMIWHKNIKLLLKLPLQMLDMTTIFAGYTCSWM